MRRLFRNNGLSIVVLLLFALFWVGQLVAGHRHYNLNQVEHGQPKVSLGQYVTSGEFWQATAENWESEFLQMAMFVILTACLYQKGSPESKDPDAPEDAVDVDPRLMSDRPDAPWPVRRGGWWLRLYSHSLSIALFTLFVISFALHAIAGSRLYNEEQLQHGGQTVSAAAYMATSQFWFESFQNWQSEFLSIGAMVLLSVYLRQRGSAESKPVATPHDESGEDEPTPSGLLRRNSGARAVAASS
jgi:hypothetical protein